MTALLGARTRSIVGGARRAAAGAPGGAPDEEVAPETPRWRDLMRHAGPVVGLCALYPLWWALGLGVLIFPIAAVPMAVSLLRRVIIRERVRVPPGFGWWLLFLAAVALSATAIDSTAAGTLERGSDGRVTAIVFRFGMYLALTVLLLYVGNLPLARVPQATLVRLLGGLFVVTVAGGLLGVVAGSFEFTSPMERLLPHHVRAEGFVRSLVHPSAAQIMDVLGHASARPAAPWGYTNTWGNNLCLLIVWFVVACWPLARTPLARVAGTLILAVAVVPVVQSLNRGLWLGLAVTVAYVAVRLAVRNRRWAVGMLAATLAGIALVGATPLGDTVGQRLEYGRSNAVRMFLVDRALDGLSESPVIGFGTTRDTAGGRTSITVGESPDCPRCGNFTVGGNGQLWQLLFAHGLVGTIGYLAFLAYGLWRFRHDSSAIGIAGSAALVASFAAMLWYNALVTPLAFLFFAYALLWRNSLVRA
jgi:hypothetical protein